ncbi:hypothetical protein PsorP6_004317 [Peronosclerospora sorghi]|uniref:Uncharacterized protein n=1 Tax=Peronosclerospora sorghi TaxID=230839 RepID=A0ACC0VP43_9STRA|nr:hypothetical protein PsorP6_004317 [Peronosclerospora sorghi]
MVLSLGLLDIVEKRKPLGASMGEDVAYEYNRNLPSGHESRDVEVLRRKFTAMKNFKKPTGRFYNTSLSLPSIYSLQPDATGGAPGEADIPLYESEMSVVELDDDARQSENVDDPNVYSSEDDDEESTQIIFLI